MWHTVDGERILKGHQAALVQAIIDTCIDTLHSRSTFSRSPRWAPPSNASAITQLPSKTGDGHQHLANFSHSFEEASFHTGVDLFDALDTDEQLGCIHLIAKCLLTPYRMTQPVAAIHDATIAALFTCLKQNVEVELLNDLHENSDDDRHSEDQASNAGETSECSDSDSVATCWRQLVYDAWREDEMHPQDQSPSVDSHQTGETRNASETSSHVSNAEPNGQQLESHDFRLVNFLHWETMIDELSGLLLFDRDFELADQFLDASPIAGRHAKLQLGITNDYFIQGPPLVPAGGFDDLLWETRELVRSNPR
ncbi:hypothetical protein [Neorhodopirellula lusitana]|uniref:hypothetical protein n=1 Tax=Neorhodopirellula lusitana TaxID=445327 RepID=UPI00384C49ED